MSPLRVAPSGNEPPLASALALLQSPLLTLQEAVLFIGANHVDVYRVAN